MSNGLDRSSLRSPGTAAPRYPQLADREWLWHRYVDEDCSASRIAGEVGCADSTVLDALKRLGIPRRGTGRAGGNRPPSVSIGDRYERLRVIAEADSRHGKRRYVCVCDCGTVGELVVETGLNEHTVRKYLRQWEGRGTVLPPTYEWNFAKPRSTATAPGRSRPSKAKNFAGAGESGRSQLPPTKEMRKVALDYGGKCRALPNGHYELTLANGQRVTLAGTPTNAGNAARAARAEIEQKLGRVPS